MIEKHRIWFDKLTKDRKESASMLEKPSMRGIKNSVVEKYSDQAHFIYELLQNANDSKATESSFRLTADGLYFHHNGKIVFDVLDPHNEDQDKEKGILGHINSITSIANSNKTESSIGKFGVGFKAVFQYTETPHIYDKNFQFKIKRFIVPKKLENDLPERKSDETIFYFPFDKTEIPAEKAYSDILEKLKSLVYPTLFLSNLQEVKWVAENESGEYTKKNVTKESSGDIFYEKAELLQQIGRNLIKENIYLFTRFTEKHNQPFSVGYFLDEKKLKPKSFSAFCFFPTKVTTNLNFIIHAPFLLTDSREGIKESESHNIKMVSELAKLSADSLLILKTLKLIDDTIFDIIPYQKESFYKENYWGCVNKENPRFFAPFYEAIKEKFKSEELLPNIDGYVVRENAYWAQDNPVQNLFSDEQLAQLIDDDDAKWVFRNLVRNQTVKDWI